MASVSSIQDVQTSPELQWTAGGYVWPTKMTIQFPTEDITNGHRSAKSLLNTARMPGFHVERGYGVPTREEQAPPVRGAFGSPYYPAGGHELVETEGDILRTKGGRSWRCSTCRHRDTNLHRVGGVTEANALWYAQAKRAFGKSRCRACVLRLGWRIGKVGCEYVVSSVYPMREEGLGL